MRHVFSPRLAVVAALCVAAASHGAPQRGVASELRRTAFVRAIERAKPSVVNIDGQKTVAGERAGDEQRVTGVGTGVVIDERGYILTNFHVVDGVRDIQVALEGGEQFAARLIGRDAETDLAVIQVDARRPLQVITTGTSCDLMEGEPVIAVGNPFGYAHTVTRGIISSLHRDVRVNEHQAYEDLIQTDASINPGNSGGPLLNIDGEMIGVNAAVRAGAQGIGFAIPVDRAMEVAASLISTERLERKWHGARVTSTGVASEQGVLIAAVEPGSPAESAGLQSGDLVVQMDDAPVRTPVDWERKLLGHSGPADLLVSRAGRTERLQLATSPLTVDVARHEDRIWEELGMRLRAVPGDQFEQAETDYDGGLLVVAVRRGGPAYTNGIRSGDVLVGLHVWETKSLGNVEYVLNSDKLPNADVKYYIVRNAEPFYGRLTIARTMGRSVRQASQAHSEALRASR